MNDMQDFADTIDEGTCDLGYALRDLNWVVYCRWVCDCAEHVLPLTESLSTSGEMAILKAALASARHYENAEARRTQLDEAVAQVSAIHERVYSAPGRMYAHALEAFEVACNAVRQADPSSGVYHEDVIYGAARAAYDGALHDDDAVDPTPESDCCHSAELVGPGESQKEREWQLEAMRRRVTEAG